MTQFQLKQYFLLLISLSLAVVICMYIGSSNHIVKSRRPMHYVDLIGSANSFSSFLLHPSSLKFALNTSPEYEAIDSNTTRKLHGGTSITMQEPSGETQANSKLPLIPEVRKWRQFGLSNDSFVYSAYYRSKEKDILIIGVGRRLWNPSIVCTFPLRPSVESVNASVQKLREHHMREYTAIFIRCPLRLNGTLEIPKILDLQVGNARTRLTIMFSKARQFNFTVCLPALHGPYKNYERLIEMVETDMILGAQRFVVFNHSTSSSVDRVLKHYVGLGVMEIRPWNIPLKKPDIHYFGQMASIQDCIQSCRTESKYVVFKDVDEVIAPHMHQTWDQMMMFLDKGDNQASFLFRNTFFETNWPDYNPVQNNTPTISCLKYIWRDNRIFQNRQRSKIILKPDLVEVGGIHFPFKVKRGCVNVPVNVSVALLHHYRKFDKNENKVKDSTMLKHTDALVSNIMKRYMELGMTFKS